MATVKFVECCDSQVKFCGGSADPRKDLEIGKSYEVDRIEIHQWHTRVFLKDFPGKYYNSVCFDDEDIKKLDPQDLLGSGGTLLGR